MLLVLEVMDLGPPRLALGAVLGALVGEVADQLLLLGVDRDHRLIVGLEGQDLGVDVLELGVTDGMLAIGFTIGPAAIAELVQQLAHRVRADRVAESHRVYRRPHFLRDWGHHDETSITQIRP